MEARQLLRRARAAAVAIQASWRAERWHGGMWDWWEACSLKPDVRKPKCHMASVAPAMWHLINAPAASAVLPLQSAWRGHVARKEAARLRRERAATRLQATWRMHRQRAAFQLQRRCVGCLRMGGWRRMEGIGC